MFGLGIRFLMGWAMAAADGAKKERAEWPTHPDRVFMALAAAWFETGQDEDEGKSLRWLEGLEAPRIAASEATYRDVLNSFVPINDKSAPIEWDSQKKKWKQHQISESLSIGRNRQSRSFPVAIPYVPIVHLIWPEDLPKVHHAPLANICRKVVSIGHSASLVQMWLTDEPPPANLVPVSGLAKHRLRVTGRGRLEYLEARCNRQSVVQWADMNERVQEAKGKEKKILQLQLSTVFPDGRPISLRPEPGMWQGYGEPAPERVKAVPGSLFDPRLIVLSLSGKKLSLPSTLKLTEAVRGALFKACPKPIPEWISGHASDGSPTNKPHLAFIPLPFAGSGHADGRLMGVALAIPHDIDPEESSRILATWLRDEYGMPRQIRLFDGQWLECVVELDCSESPPWNLRQETWTGPARLWSTVTPVVLDRHFDGENRWEKAAESIKDACERIGLPRPTEALLHPVSMLEGVPRSNQFPWLTRKKDGGRMHHTHAVIAFEQEVAGPVVVGAGRFRGYGLCRPVHQGGESHV